MMQVKSQATGGHTTRTPGEEDVHMPKFRVLPTPSEMISHLDKFVYGQDTAKRDLATAVYRHYLSWADRQCSDKNVDRFGKRHVLIFGPTGSGKTSMVRTLVDYLGVSSVFADAASLVEAGYVGGHFTDIVRRLIVSEQGNVNAVSSAIFFIDEIDKIRRQECGGRDVAGEGVQNSLLSPLDGCSVDITFGDRTLSIDTSGFLFICTGAFTGLADIIRARLNAATKMGFHASTQELSELTDDDALSLCEMRDLRAYGMIPEFLGRLGTITAVRSLSRDDLIHVLKDTENSPLKRQEYWFDAHDIKLVVPDEALLLIADRAIRDGTYARGLDAAIGKLLSPYDWQLTELAATGCNRLTFTPESVNGTAPPVLEHGRRNPTARSSAFLLRRVAADMIRTPPPTELGKSTRPPQNNGPYSPPMNPSSNTHSHRDRPDPEEPAYWL